MMMLKARCIFMCVTGGLYFQCEVVEMGFTGVTGARMRSNTACKQMKPLFYPLWTGQHFYISLACNTHIHTKPRALLEKCAFLSE